MSTKNNTIGTKLKFQDLPTVDANKKLTALEFNQLVDFQNSPVQQIAGSLDDTDIVITGTKNYATTIVVVGATRTITANASGHIQGNNIKQRYQYNQDCALTLVNFDTPGNNTGTITPIPAGTYDFQYLANRNGRNLEIAQNQVSRNRLAPTIAANVLDIDFESKNDFKTTAEVAATADFAITLSNDNNADIATIDLFITNTVIITLPSGSIMEDSETRWVGTPTFELTIEGGTGESFELSLNKVGAKYKWVMSTIFE